MAPFRMKQPIDINHVKVQKPTHWLATEMSLSGKYNDIRIHMIIIILEAPYRRTGYDMFDRLDNSLGKLHSET